MSSFMKYLTDKILGWFHDEQEAKPIDLHRDDAPLGRGNCFMCSGPIHVDDSCDCIPAGR